MAYVHPGGGTYYFGNAATPVNFSSELIRVDIVINRPTVAVPPTYGSPVIYDAPGHAFERIMNIEFLGDPTSSSSLWYQFVSALENDGLLAFECLLYPGSANELNPWHRGNLVVETVTHGVAFNQLHQGSVSYKIDDTYTKSES